jgi:hypothetical protein
MTLNMNLRLGHYPNKWSLGHSYPLKVTGSSHSKALAIHIHHGTASCSGGLDLFFDKSLNVILAAIDFGGFGYDRCTVKDIGAAGLGRQRHS